MICLFSSQLLQAAGGAKQRVMTNQTPQQLEAEHLNQPLTSAELKASTRVIFQRVIQARIYHAGTWTLAGTSQTPANVARTLASLQPSFVTGLLRLSDHGELSNAEEEGFLAVRSAVRSASKSCRFDIVINAGNETSGDTFIRHLREVNVRIHPDAWTFYVQPDDNSLSPDVFDQGIAFAHSCGQMVGYDGPLSLIPEGVDFIVVRAWDLKLNRKVIDQLRSRHHVPLIVELPTTFGTRDQPEIETYVNDMNSGERVSVVTRLAQDQGEWGYRFAYPIIYPLHPAKQAFDATKDNILLVTIRALMARFN